MRISVITVTLNAERFLSDCLASVAAQGDSLFEHIIVDGGSTDATIDIIRNYSANNPRISWISEPDRGISDAMNKGLKLATGDVINFLHADDCFTDESVLETVCAEFSNQPEIVWLTGGLRQISADDINLGEIRVRRYTFGRLVRGNIILHPATFVKRQSILAIGGFNIKLKYAMDYDLWLRLGAQESPYCLDRLLACFRVHSGSLSTVKIAEAFAEEAQIRHKWLRDKPLLQFFYTMYDFIKAPVTVWSSRNVLKRSETPGR